MKRRWRAAPNSLGNLTEKPNLITGPGAGVCWHKIRPFTGCPASEIPDARAAALIMTEAEVDCPPAMKIRIGCGANSWRTFTEEYEAC